MPASVRRQTQVLEPPATTLFAGGSAFSQTWPAAGHPPPFVSVSASGDCAVYCAGLSEAARHFDIGGCEGVNAAIVSR